MKSNKQSSLYFSAYPLKAIKESSSEQSPFLKAILSGKTRTLSRIRVSPMLNPYKVTIKPAGMKTERVKVSKDIEPTSNEWFNNYE